MSKKNYLCWTDLLEIERFGHLAVCEQLIELLEKQAILVTI